MDYFISDVKPHIAVKGRGTGSTVKGRFDCLQVNLIQEDSRQIKTQIFQDSSRSIIAYNKSPDVGFNASINPYRGCEHGCIYCYARPTHEYFGLSSGLDFETKIFAKMEAATLLKKELEHKSFVPQPLGMSGVTDCYQPIERELTLTRQCLRVLASYRNPVVIITKNYLVTRDIDILTTLVPYQAIHVIISITTLDNKLARTMEPRASTPEYRLKAIEELHRAHIPVGVNVAPLIPGLTDHEMPLILEKAASKGASSAHYTMLRLPYSVKDLFENWLTEHFPDRKSKVLTRLKEIRDGKLNSAQFGDRMLGNGPYADHIAHMFSHYKKRYQLNKMRKLSTQHFHIPSDQLSLF